MGIEAVKQKYEERLMRLPNVVGVGIGERSNKAVIAVFVTHKVPKSELNPEEIIPKTLDEYRTVVEEIGNVTSQT